MPRVSKTKGTSNNKSSKLTKKQSNNNSNTFKQYKKSVHKIISTSFKHKQTHAKSINISEHDKHVSYKFNGDGKFIPKFKIINSPYCASVIMSLKKGECVYANYGSMNYCDGTVDISTKSQGVFKSLIRMFFTTSSYFLNYYTGVYDKESLVSFSSNILGDIKSLLIKKGDSYTLSTHCFLCATPNVDLTTTTRLSNLFISHENIFLNEVSLTADCNDNGMVWISSYGSFDKLTVKDGESIKINGGIFAYTKSSTKFTISTVGNIKSFLFSGSSVLMEFTGPCEVYVRSQNFSQYVQYLNSVLNPDVLQNYKHK